MPDQAVDPRVQGLVNRAHDIDRFIALYRAELAGLPAAPDGAADPVLHERQELEDLLLIVEDLWEAVSGRTARLYEEMQERLLSAEVERELSRQGERWHRYLLFAAAAGIRVPAPN